MCPYKAYFPVHNLSEHITVALTVLLGRLYLQRHHAASVQPNHLINASEGHGSESSHGWANGLIEWKGGLNEVQRFERPRKFTSHPWKSLVV